MIDYCIVWCFFSVSDCDDILNVSTSPRAYSGCTEELRPTCCSVRSGDPRGRKLAGLIFESTKGTFWMKPGFSEKYPG